MRGGLSFLGSEFSWYEGVWVFGVWGLIFRHTPSRPAFPNIARPILLERLLCRVTCNWASDEFGRHVFDFSGYAVHMPTSFPGSLFSRSRGREEERPWERGCLHARCCQSVNKAAFSNVAIFLAFAAFFAAYVLTEALFVKRKVAIWVVVSVEAIKLRSDRWGCVDRNNIHLITVLVVYTD